MPKKIPTPVIENHRLETFDPDGDTYVAIRQATQLQNEARATLFGNYSSKDGQTSWSVKPTEVMRKEVFLTLAGSNMIDDADKPLFKFTPDNKLAMTEEEFGGVWGKLPPAVADEIHEKVLKQNPTWLPLRG